MESSKVIILLLVCILILNLYQLDLIQIEPFNIKPSKNNIYDYVNNDIKEFYKKIAIKNNDSKTEIKKIISIKPIEGFNSNSNSNYLIKYQLNNDVIGTRRFYINRKGNVLAMSSPV